jgi:hypothetical protein
MVQWRTLMNMVINIWGPTKCEEFVDEPRTVLKFKNTYARTYLYFSCTVYRLPPAPSPPNREFCVAVARSFSHWLPCSHPILTIFPIGPARILPCPTSSLIWNQFLVRGLLIAPMMEAVSNAETSVYFHQTTRRNNPEKAVFTLAAVRTWNLTWCNMAFLYSSTATVIHSYR